MTMPAITCEITTLGGFGIRADDKPVALPWPDETLKVLFCALLSPQEMCIDWDRICRSTWGKPATPDNRNRLEDTLIQPLSRFLIRELGFDPCIKVAEGIRLDSRYIHLDAGEFYTTAVEGVRLMSLGNHVAAFEKLQRAKTLYAGYYLPGIPGTIVAETRNDLEALYLHAILDVMPQTRGSGFSGYKRMSDFGQYLTSHRRPFEESN